MSNTLLVSFIYPDVNNVNIVEVQFLLKFDQNGCDQLVCVGVNMRKFLIRKTDFYCVFRRKRLLSRLR